MSGKPLVFHPEAVAEAEAAVAWYRERSLRAAEAFVVELEDTLRAIQEAPGRWSPFEADTRRLPLRRYPYFVVYRDRTGQLRSWLLPMVAVGPDTGDLARDSQGNSNFMLPR